MNTNELINSDLLPRNVPKPSSFHENTLKPEVPEVSLMFENGFPYNKANDTNKQAQPERPINNSKVIPESTGDRPNSSPGLFNPTEYKNYELPQKTSYKGLTPNIPKTTPDRHSKPDKFYTTKSSSDEMDSEKQTFDKHDRQINSESHLIEPIESYSVWKYKNHHMFVKENEQATQKQIRQYNSPELKNHEMVSGQPHDRNNPDQHQEASQKRMRNFYSPEFRNDDSNKPHYRQEREFRMTYFQTSPFDQGPSNHREGFPKNMYEHHSPSVEYCRKNPYKTRDQIPGPNLTEKSNWRYDPRMNFDRSELEARPTEQPYQKNDTDTNNVGELCKLVEYQSKHIEFLNEQIYTLTLQNKTLSNLTKHIKTLEDVQTKQTEIMEENFNKFKENFLNAMEKISQRPSNTSTNVEAFSEKNLEYLLGKMEKKLTEVINSKVVMNNEPKTIASVPENQYENESSSSEDTLPTSYKQTASKECNCICDGAKPCTKFKSKANKKSPGIKTDQRIHPKNTDQQVAAKDWEYQSGHGNQINSKKPSKKSQRKPDYVEKVALNSTTPQPVLYFPHMYQGDKVASNNRRVIQSENLKTDNKKSPDEKLHASRTRKAMKSKPHHFVRNGHRNENNPMNDEHSLTLNARELPVINEHIPSPEASVHIDMAEYQSSSSEFNDSDEENRQISVESEEEDGAPWPTFYNNVVGKVHKLLQGNQQPAVDVPDDQYRTVQVRMATIDQFKKMGISFVDDSPNGKRVTFNKNKKKLNQHPDTHMGESAKRSPLTAVCNTNLSFASLQYLQRYHLLPTPNIQTQEPMHHELNQED